MQSESLLQIAEKVAARSPKLTKVLNLAEQQGERNQMLELLATRDVPAAHVSWGLTIHGGVEVSPTTIKTYRNEVAARSRFAEEQALSSGGPIQADSTEHQDVR